MSYPSRYYAMQRTVILDIGFAKRTGLCPVCRQNPCGTWPSGGKRITCGNQSCFLRWLPVRETAG